MSLSSSFDRVITTKMLDLANRSVQHPGDNHPRLRASKPYRRLPSAVSERPRRRVPTVLVWLAALLVGLRLQGEAQSPIVHVPECVVEKAGAMPRRQRRDKRIFHDHVDVTNTLADAPEETFFQSLSPTPPLR